MTADTDLSLMGNLFRLDGKVAVVTGGGRGLGLAITRGLVAHGATVVIGGRDRERLAAAARDLNLERLNGGTHVLDVAREESVAAMVAWVLGTFGRVDVLVNNAGINPHYRAPEDTSLTEWREIVDVNLTGVFLCCREFGRPMVAQGSGSIINVSSVAGHTGMAKTTAYCAAKGGVELMTRSLAIDWATKGLRVNALAPGYFETDLTAGVREHPILRERLLSKTPMGRFGAPRELAGAAVFLASDASSYVTGQSLLVDGGWVAG